MALAQGERLGTTDRAHARGLICSGLRAATAVASQAASKGRNIELPPSVSI